MGGVSTAILGNPDSWCECKVDCLPEGKDNGLLFQGRLMKSSARLRKTANLSKSTNHQLHKYALAASAAGVGILALVQPAEAKIIYTPAHWTIPSGGHYQLDLNHDGVTDFVLANMFRSLNSSYSGSSSALVYPFNKGANRVYGRGNFASCLQKGVRVGPGGHFSPSDRVMARMHWFDGSYSVR